MRKQASGREAKTSSGKTGDDRIQNRFCGVYHDYANGLVIVVPDLISGQFVEHCKFPFLQRCEAASPPWI
jgi:hypothetical protein